MDQVTGTSPSSVLSPKSSHTVLDALTMLVLLVVENRVLCHTHSRSHSHPPPWPLRWSHCWQQSWPFVHTVCLNLLHHPLDSATTFSGRGWQLLSHPDGSPPSPPGRSHWEWEWPAFRRGCMVGSKGHWIRGLHKRSMNTRLFAMFTLTLLVAWCARVSVQLSLHKS